MAEDDADDGYNIEQEQADFEQAEMEVFGQKLAALEKKGICIHGHKQGYNGKNTPHLKVGQAECLHCHKIATDEEFRIEWKKISGD